MGLDLCVATKYEVNWEPVRGMRNCFDEFEDYLEDHEIEYVRYTEENNNQLEINADEENLQRIRGCITDLRKTPDEELFDPLRHRDSVVTCGQFADALESILDKYDKKDDVIHVYWI
jgi:hypothetical protein